MTPDRNKKSSTQPGLSPCADQPEKVARGAREEERDRRADLADLIAGMAHEVANALGAVEGWARLAREKRTLSERDEALTRLEQSAQITTKLARSMLRIARGDDHGPREYVDLSEVASSVTKMMAPIAQGANVRIETYLPKHAWLRGNYPALVSVLWNVVQNAVEVSEPGAHVEVHLSEEGAMLHLEVLDEGPGIADAVLPHLFEAYTSGKKGGTGLGLALVKKSVLAHGGSIEAQNRPRGARFSIKFPAVVAPSESRMPPRAASLRPASLRPRLKKLSVLIVEDDEPLREMVSTGLSLLGASVTGVASAAEARDHAGEVDVLVVDLTLTDERGDKLVSTLRHTGRSPYVIMVSGLSTMPPGLESQCFDRWIRKPYELEELAEAIADAKTAKQ